MKNYMAFILLVLIFQISVSSVFAQTEPVNTNNNTIDVRNDNRPQPDPAEGVKNNEEVELKESKPNEVESIAEAEKEILSVPILFKEKTFFKIAYQNEDDKKAKLKRAQEASTALEKAMSLDEPVNPDGQIVEVNFINPRLIEVKVRGFKILELTSKDAKAAGFENFQEYADFAFREMSLFVSQTLDQLKIQKLALKFFLSVFFGLLGFVVFRRVIILFNKADRLIEIKKDKFKPLIFLSETLITGQTLGGLLASLLVLGRMLTYLVVVLTTTAAIFGQFTFSRNLMGSFFAELLAGTFKVLQSLLESIPGLILAFSLLFILQLSLKVLHLYLKGVRSGRISWKFLQENRTPVVDFWGPAILIVFFLPLTVASIFGRFNTPLEFIFVGAAVVLTLAQLPVLASIAAGSFIIWQGHIRVGEWIQVGELSGEVTDIHLHQLTLVPHKGGRVHIPMIRLLFNSFSESREAPPREFHFAIKKTTGLTETFEKIKKLMPEEKTVIIQCRGLSESSFQLALKTSDFRNEDTNLLYEIFSRAQDKGEIQMTENFQEIST